MRRPGGAEGREAAGSAALLLVGAAIFGTNYVVLKWALLGGGVYTVALFRALFGALLMVVVCAATRTSLRVPLRRADLSAVVLPGLMMTASQLTFAFGVKNTAAGLASLLSNLMPVFSALLAWAVLREQLSRVTLAGVAVALGGVAVATTVADSSRSTHAIGIVMMLLAVLTWASSNVLLKRRRPAGGEIAFSTWMLVIAAIVFAPLAGAVEGYRAHWSWELVGELLFAGGAGQIAFLCVLLVLRRGSVTRASMVSFMVPVFGIASGALLLDEAVHWQELAGGALIFLGVWLVVFRGSRASRPAA